jgi:hypothetical protein
MMIHIIHVSVRLVVVCVTINSRFKAAKDMEFLHNAEETIFARISSTVWYITLKS